MEKFGRKIGTRGMRFLRAAGLMVIAVPVAFGLAHATPSRGHSQSQNTAAIGPEFKYEPISIKLLRTDATPDFRGLVADLEPDGITIRIRDPAEPPRVRLCRDKQQPCRIWIKRQPNRWSSKLGDHPPLCY